VAIEAMPLEITRAAIDMTSSPTTEKVTIEDKKA